MSDRLGRKLVWSPAEAPREIHRLLDELGKYYPIQPGGNGVVFKRGEAGILKVGEVVGRRVVTYPDLPGACRAIGGLLAGQTRLPGTPAGFDTAGFMLDCSRNAVPTLAYLKEWVRRMALFGYNLLMLYTEDTYQLEGEPFFGYQRGGYSKEEIHELDDYAALFGIELVPCILSGRSISSFRSRVSPAGLRRPETARSVSPFKRGSPRFGPGWRFRGRTWPVRTSSFPLSREGPSKLSPRLPG